MEPMTPTLTCPNCQSPTSFQAWPSQPPHCAQCAAPLPWLHDGSDASLPHVVQASVPVLVDFWAPWCAPCRIMGPVLEDVALTLAGNVRVVKVNVDEHPRAAEQYGVQAIPTLLLFLHGEVVDEVVGAVPAFMLRDRVNHLLDLSGQRRR